MMPLALDLRKQNDKQYYHGLVLQSVKTGIYKRVGTFRIFCDTTVWEA